MQQVRKFSRVFLNRWDWIYILFASIAGAWQAWCFSYGRNSISLPVLMSLPFALASYAHASLLNKAGIVDEWPDWRRVFVLWGGMPVSIVACFLTILAETQILNAVYGRADNLPFYDVTVFIGEAAGSVVWAGCLLVWSGQRGLRPSLRRLPTIFATLFASVVSAYGVATLIYRSFHKDSLIVLTSVFITVTSAVMLILLRSKVQQSVEDTGGVGFERL